MLTGIIRGQRLMLRTPIVVADSINYLTAKFTFDPDWTGRTVTAYFVCGDKAITAELTDGEITAAQGINLTAGRWELKLSGIKGDSRVTAGPVQFDVLPFGATEGELPDISLTQYEQLLAKIGDMDELTTTDKDTLVAAINEAAQSGGGSGQCSDCDRMVAALLSPCCKLCCVCCHIRFLPLSVLTFEKAKMSQGALKQHVIESNI